jgi:hypothetical protein
MTYLGLLSTEIAALRLRYSLSTFVETGCHEGTGVELARNWGFSHIYTCDVHVEYARRTQDRVPGAHVYWTDSISFLNCFAPDGIGRKGFVS